MENLNTIETLSHVIDALNRVGDNTALRIVIDKLIEKIKEI